MPNYKLAGADLCKVVVEFRHHLFQSMKHTTKLINMK